MASILPFRGIRYNQEKVGSLDSVVTPPYDVISPDEQLRYLGRHPNNVVRLILPAETTGDEPGSKYRRAGECLSEWLDSGVLLRDEEPSLYAVEQEFEFKGETKRRLGLTCLLRLEDFDKRTVLPHENILAKPLDDRLNLLRSTRSNFDSVFGLYSDGRVEGILRPFLLRDPDSVATDTAGVRAGLRKISDPEAVEAVKEALANEQVLIADGHHRYTAALAYRDEMRERHGFDPNAPHEFVMMTLVSLQDPGLVILPTHRLVKNLEDFDRQAFIDRLSELFELRKFPADFLPEKLESMAGGQAFGLYMGADDSYTLKLKPGLRPETVIDGPGSDALKRLDVSVLHSLVLEKPLGIGAGSLSAQSNVFYSKDARDAVKSVESGEYLIAVLMNPTRVDEVKEIAASGERMPQKSTFFYPKLLTGQIMRVIE